MQNMLAVLTVKSFALTAELLIQSAALFVYFCRYIFVDLELQPQ